MAYYKKNSYGGNNYNRYNNRNNYGGNNYNNNQQPAKRSGAKYSKIAKGKFKGGTIINAWNKSRSKGMLLAKVAPYKGTKQYKNAKGEEKQTMMCELTYVNSGHTRLIPCSINLETQVVALPEIGMVITPNGRGVTSTGKKVTGYFGKFN
ncbi:hypothetical protein [Pontimicrobium aquaticum]|uniref:Uncharacterized protein n=1 Tax=Pontimicrobium aquaticum TaxID=2565367 RepID=A0A4U0EP33_9FLAO|nr:hypothetical protein [Pontimicrobium aquaticum]TJY33383.1 hypothetical protein E5167_12850 [Pontimicrobium aquaticum]